MTKTKFGQAPEVGHCYRVRVHCGPDIVSEFEGVSFELPTIEFTAVVTMIMPETKGGVINDDGYLTDVEPTGHDWIYFDNGVMLRRWDNVSFEDAPHPHGAGWHYTSP